MSDPVTHPLVARLLDHPKLPSILKGLGLFLRDFRTGEFFTNAFWSELGYESPQDPQLWTNLLHPDDRVHVINAYHQLLGGERDTFEAEFRIKDSSGVWRWVNHRSIILERDASKIPTLYAGIDHEITEYKTRLVTTESALRQFENKYWQTESLRVAGTIVSSELDPEKTAKVIFEQARNLLPFDAAVVWAVQDESLTWLGGHNLCRHDLLPLHESGESYQRVLEARQPLLMTDYVDKYPERFLDPHTHFRGWLGVPLIFQNQIVGIVEFLTKVPGTLKLDVLWSVSLLAEQTAVALANARRFRSSEEEASTDPLTGLLTRRTFERLAKRSWGNQQPSAVLMLDLDHFKDVNDRFGHGAGDEVLRRAAAVCRTVLREGDLICRWGGEELAIMLSVAKPHAASKAADRIRREIETLRFEAYPLLRLTTSIGLVFCPCDSTFELTSLIEMADRALYQAKRDGRNRVRSFRRSRRAS